jgi:tetratricopeptide (TPR) repeat protein
MNLGFSIDDIISSSQNENIKDYTLEQLIELAKMVAEEHGNYRYALLLSEIALYKDSNNWKANYIRGTILEMMGLTDASLFSFKRALQLNENSSEIYYSLGRVYHIRGNYEAALNSYFDAYKLNSTNKYLVNDIALCYINLNKTIEVLEWSKKAYEMGKELNAIYNYSLGLAMNNDFIKAFQIAEELEKKQFIYSKLQALIYYLKEDFEQSIKKIDFLFANGSLDYELARIKYFSLLKLNKVDLALGWIKKIEDDFPLTATDYNEMGYALISNFQMYEESIPFFEKSIKGYPELMYPWVNLQFAYIQMRLFDKALDYCDRYLKINPIDPKTILNKITIFGNKKKYMEIFLFCIEKLAELTGKSEQLEEIRGKVNSYLETLGLNNDKVDELIEYMRQNPKADKTEILTKYLQVRFE